MIVALVLLIRKHCLPYLQVRITYNIRFKNKNKFVSPFKQHFFLIAIGLATYFLRLQIIILMRGKRSTGNENILEEFRIVLDDHIGEMQFDEEIFRISNLSDEN